MSERKISWESFHIDKFKETERDEYLKTLDESDEEESEIAEELRNMPTIVDTPYGGMIADDSLNPLNRIEHWMLHSNFNITEKEFVIINFIEGVEAIQSVSRYQILVGFGRLFDVGMVKRDIEQKLIKIDDYSEQLYQTQREVLLMN